MPVCFDNQIVIECLALITKCEWFVQLHIEVGAGTGFVLLLSGFEIW